jgi:hypothetical protein
MAKLWLECDSTTTQQARNKANGDTKKNGNNHENEEYITATLWLERRFNNDTGVRNQRKNRLEMFVRTGTTLL